jgi:hypothetical protein
MPVTNVPTPGSPIRSNWAQSVSNVANANETAVTRLMADTGYTNLTLAAGWGGTLGHRRVGGWVFLNLAVQRTGANVSATDVTLVFIGPASRPAQTIQAVVIAAITPYRAAVLSADGALTVFGVTMSTNQIVYGQISYPITLP